ncbi:QRFP-like peptide receptor [Orussus abietinus]|uniref:QRFP-like peptide receptor n=1 Tax=Orussus abietinus TaxID=222816 RepID=UPI0006252C90|nr:QRFP-like peptide receptor [Orussus abietinus]
MFGIPESDLTVFDPETRVAFQILIWPIVIAGVVANFGVVWRIYRAEYRNAALKIFYRGALLSMAMSDVLLLTTSGLNTLTVARQGIILWLLPECMCTVLPYLQTVAVLVGSLTLAGIAADRYSSMKSNFPSSVMTKWPCAVGFVLLIWCIAAATSYPVLRIYKTYTILVINGSSRYRSQLCVVDRSSGTAIYTILFAVIFLPLGITFVTIHLLLAFNIWERRNPGGDSRHATGDSQITESATASTGVSRSGSASKRKKVCPAHVLRKKRIIKVILLLIIVFAVCRLPIWIFLLYKLNVTLSGMFWWHLQVVLSTLSFIGAAVNPFLYAFLNETLSLVSWLKYWFSRKDNFDVTTANRENKDIGIGTVKIPRGPYSP